MARESSVLESLRLTYGAARPLTRGAVARGRGSDARVRYIWLIIRSVRVFILLSLLASWDVRSLHSFTPHPLEVELRGVRATCVTVT